MELKLQAKRKAFDSLRFKEPDMEYKRFIQYKNVNLTNLNVVNTISSEEFYTELELNIEDFKEEVKGNRYSEHYGMFLSHAVQELEEILRELNEGLRLAVKMTLILADIDDFSDLDFYNVMKRIPSEILMECKISSLRFLINRQIREVEGLLKWLPEIEKEEIVIKESNQTFERKKMAPKINSNLKKNELVTLFWLLGQARFLKFENNKVLASFLESNFRYSRAGTDNDLSGVEIEISRLEDYQIERMQEEMLSELSKELQEFNEKILATLSSLKVKKGKKE